MPLDEALKLLNDRSRRIPAHIQRAREAYYAMSLHVDGAAPAYTDLRNNVMVKPYNYFGKEYQRIFDTKLFARYPRESEVTREFRKSQYRPFTKDPFQAAINFTVGALFHDSGYNIQIENEDDNAYIWGANFEGGDIGQFFQKHFKSICVDANGFFVVIPKEPAAETTTERIEPDIWFVPSIKVLHVGLDSIIFDRGDITWVVTNLAYYRIAKDPNTGDYYPLDEEWYYGHQLGYIPAFIAGGVWNTQGFLESWLTGGLAWADEYVAAKSTAQLVDKENSHPYIIEPSTDCPDCINGEREVCGGCFSTASECACAGDNYTPLIQKCSTCRGTGILQRDPAQHLVVPPEVLEKNSDLVRIVNPDTDINKYHQENNLALYKQLFEAIYLRYVDQAQSGKAKELDLEGRLNFYTAVSNDLFDRLIPSVLETILALRDIQVINGVKVPKVGEYTILKPVTFLMQSAEELLSEYDAAVKAGVPTYLTSALLDRYVEKQFVNDALLRKKAKVINALDDLATRPDDKIQMMGMTGFIPIERVKMHYQLPTMVEDLIRDRGKQWFVEASTDAIREALNFDARLEEMKTTIAPNYDIEGG